MVLKRIGLIALPAWSLFFAAQCGTARAQQIAIRDQLVGTWELVSVTSEADDGKKAEPFGPNPKGIIMFSNGGHFSLFQSKAEIPRIAANDRAKATPEEALAIVASAIAYYGTYTVSEADKTILVKVNVSTFANVAGGPEQKRIITSLTPDELKFTNPRTPAGVTLQTAWKRFTAR